MERDAANNDILKWSALLVEAVNKPGLIMEAYSAFHRYSIGNQILALVQCQRRGLQPGPLNTFPKWKELGRVVKRGERALSLCMPITRKSRDNDSEEERTFTSFIYKARWFVLNQTDGRELEPISIPEWDSERAIETLGIERVPFDHTDGNCQGFARLCCRQHNRAYVTKSVMWRRVNQSRKYAFLAICAPHKFSPL